MRNVLTVIVTLLVAAGAIYGAALLVLSGAQYGIAWILAQESQVAAAIIATSGPLLAGVLAFVIGQQRNKSREIAEAHRPMKVEFYSQFLIGTIEMVHRLSRDDAPEDPNDDEELVKFFRSTTTSMMLWASPGVLRAWSEFREASERSQNPLLKFDGLIRAIRKDLGHRDWLLAQGVLVKLMISDPSNVDAQLTV